MTQSPIITYDNFSDKLIFYDFESSKIYKIGSDNISTSFVDIDGKISALAFDSIGNLYASCFNEANSWIEKIDSLGNSTILDTDYNYIGLAFDSSNNLYGTSFVNGTIDKYDLDGNMTIFASGLVNPCGIVIEVPESATLLLLTLGGLLLRKK
ncbi:MAG: hypothetical protein BWY69_01665 [Planctomycetes bacterium ADurb.Bin401]|nr:MAG: hypothetical protein BWY69_01665 [Planctomycetes bacterium ADurb.Bin401]